MAQQVFNIYYYEAKPGEVLPENAYGMYISIPIEHDDHPAPGAVYLGTSFTDEQKEILISNHMLTYALVIPISPLRYFPN